MRNML